jgi:transcription initiation factor TFIID subunit 15
MEYHLTILQFSDKNPYPDGTQFMGERLIVQFAKGSRREQQPFAQQERPAPRPRRTPYRMTLTGLSADTSWQVRLPSPLVIR